MHMENGRQPVTARPLGLVREVVENIGLQVSYAYEDLVFVDHNDFLLQFGATETEVLFYRNRETVSEEGETVFQRLDRAAGSCGLSLRYSGSYSLRENDDDTIRLEFFQSPSEQQGLGKGKKDGAVGEISG